MDTFLTHFGITIPDGGSFNMPYYFLPTPSAIFLSVAARGAIFWILNIVLIFVAISVGKRVALEYYSVKYIAPAIRSIDNNNSRALPQQSSTNQETSYTEVSSIRLGGFFSTNFDFIFK